MSILQKIGLILIILGLILPVLGVNLNFFGPSALTPEDIPSLGRVTVNGYLVDSINPSNPSYVPQVSGNQKFVVEWDCDKDSVVVTLRRIDDSLLGKYSLAWSGSGIWRGEDGPVILGIVKLTVRASVSPPTTTELVIKERTVYYAITGDAPLIRVYWNDQPIDWNATITTHNPNISWKAEVTNNFYASQLYFRLSADNGAKTIEEWSIPSFEKLGPFTTDTFQYRLPYQGNYKIVGRIYGAANEVFTIMDVNVRYYVGLPPARRGEGWGLIFQWFNLFTLAGFACLIIGTLWRKRNREV